MNPKKFFQDLLQAGAIDLAKYVLIIVTGTLVAGVTSASSASYLNLSGIQFWSLVVAMTTFILFGVLVLYQKSSSNRPVFAPISPNFRIREIEIELEYLPEDKFKYSKTKRLTALKDNIRSMYDQFHWTGDKDIEMDCADPNHILVERAPRNIWRRYEVDFQKNLKAGDEEDVGVFWSLSNSSRRFVPFMSTSIEQPTDKVVLRLDVGPLADKVGKVHVEVLPMMGVGDPVEAKELESRNGVYEFSQERPRLLHTYELRWNMLG